jgi:uncharacterized protein involved in exopolysaccharide biosynthesis
MKAIQITFDERLLEKLGNDEEVKQEGRSAVIRRAVADSLRAKRQATIAAAYRRAYGKQPAESDLSEWAEKGVWPDEQLPLLVKSGLTSATARTNGGRTAP